MAEHELIETLRAAVIRGDPHRAVQVAQQVVAEGVDPVVAYEQGLRQGIAKVGDGYANGELFLPDLVIAADTMKAAAAVLEQEIRRVGSQLEARGKVVLGTVAGDLHDIGKTIVATLFASHGFEVIDLGVDVPIEKFIQTVQEERPEILGMSSLLTVTAQTLGRVIQALEEAGLRETVKVIVGGGAVTEAYAEAIRADAYGENAELGLRRAKLLLGVD
jgi:corrinoid protein of di/trimethylamine methyltransferase